MPVNFNAETDLIPRVNKDGKIKKDRYRVHITDSISVKLEVRRACLDRRIRFGSEAFKVSVNTADRFDDYTYDFFRLIKLPPFSGNLIEAFYRP